MPIPITKDGTLDGYQPGDGVALIGHLVKDDLLFDTAEVKRQVYGGYDIIVNVRLRTQQQQLLLPVHDFDGKFNRYRYGNVTAVRNVTVNFLYHHRKMITDG